MNEIMKIKVQHWQRGMALLIIMLIILLLATSLLLARLNKGDTQLIRQEQTVKALARAKAALIGFAATYADDPDHKGQPQGYLPCPDFNGDGSSANAGSSDASCGDAQKSVIGRLPWRTLGLPPLRDGNGDCLWYAVSGSYKDNPKRPLTSDDDGLFIIKDANGNTTAGVTATDRAIAVVFSSGKPLGSQNRVDNGTVTECGSTTTAPTMDTSNDVSNYLESLGGINNATGGGKLAYDTSGTGNSGFFATSNALEVATFVSAPETKDANGQVIFNDALSIITPKDFEPVYRRMNEWIAEQVMQCIVKYRNNNATDFLKRYSIPIGGESNPNPQSYRGDPIVQSYVQNYIQHSINNCKSNYCSCNSCRTQNSECQKNCKSDVACKNECTVVFNVCQANYKATTNIAACENKCEQNESIYKTNANVIQISNSYPWATSQIDFQSVEESERKFGRVPMKLLNTTIPDPSNPSQLITVHAENMYMSGNWPVLNNQQCFENTNDLGDNKWGWWSKWREMVFYTIDNEYTPVLNTHLWVDVRQNATQHAPTSCLWDWELGNDYDNRIISVKKQTLAKIKQPVSNPILPSDWEWVNFNTLPTFPQDQKLLLRHVDPNGSPPATSTSSANFLVIVSGRKLTAQLDRDNHKQQVEYFLEPNNDAVANGTLTPNTFDRKVIDATFNDVLCKNNVADCQKIPQGNNQ